MHRYFIFVVMAVTGFSTLALAQFSSTLLSVDLASSPSNGNCLTTDGTNNTWSTCASGGGGGSDVNWTWNQTPNEINSDGASTTATTSVRTSAIFATSTTVNSTFIGFTATRSTTTAATSTSLFSTLLNATTGYITDIIGTRATITNATHTSLFSTGAGITNLTIGSLSGILKGASGVVGTASNGTDYTLISGTTCSGSDKVSAVSASGVVTCSSDQTGGGGSSNWLFNGTRLSPSTTVGIGVFASSTLTDLSSTNATATNLIVPTSINVFGGGAKTSATDLCIQLTGSSALCDGVDNTAAGGSGLSTSTAIASTQVIYGTSESTVGAESAFTYDSSTNVLRVDGASSTYGTTSNFAITSSLKFFSQLWSSLADFTTYIYSLFTGGDGITFTTGTIDFNCSEVEGSGINCSTNDITLDATGDWTGTLDGFEGATLAQGNWLYNGSRLSPSSTVGIGVFASSTITDLSSTYSTTTLSHYIGTSLRIGTTTDTYFSGNASKLLIDMGSANTSEEAFVIRGDVNDFLEDNIINQNTGNKAQSCRTATANGGTASSNFITMCANNSGFNFVGNNFIGGPGDTSLQSLAGGDLIINNATPTKSILFVTGNSSSTTNTRLKIDGNGLVGIGTTTPTTLLQLFSTGTTTQSLDSNSTSKGACIELKDRDGSGYTYITANNGVLYSSTVSCK